MSIPASLMRVVCAAAGLLAAASIVAPVSDVAARDASAPATAFAAQGGTELRGRVTRADGQTVWIAMESEMWPRPGDPVKLQQTVSGVLLAMGGEWTVTEVTAEFVRAEPGREARGNPARDYVAVIRSASPQPRPAAATRTGGPGTGGGSAGRGSGNDPIDLDKAAALYDAVLGSITDEPSRDEVAARANAGDPWAQTQMGIYYLNGDGVTQSYEEAARWYRLAADQGWVHAMTNLGGMYEQGLGVPQDLGEAVAWYRRAAELGFDRGQRALGYMYQTGRGVSVDLAEAIRLYRLAAAQGYADAHNDLGTMYQQGWGVAQDDAQAIAWFRSGAELGNAWAFVNLAEHYESGRGVPADRHAAIENYKAAARLGNTKAQDWLRREGIEWRQ